MNKFVIIVVLFFSGFLGILEAAPIYGNWSGVLYTQSIPVQKNNPNLRQYTLDIQRYLLTSYKGKYVQLITYVVKRVERYTISIKFPQDGVSRSLIFTGYNPFASSGYAISYQNKKYQGRYMLYRINFSNSRESKYENMVVIVVTNKPLMPFYLRIQHPAVPDGIVDARHPNPGDPAMGAYFWGTIIKHPLVLK